MDGNKDADETFYSVLCFLTQPTYEESLFHWKVITVACWSSSTPTLRLICVCFTCGEYGQLDIHRSSAEDTHLFPFVTPSPKHIVSAITEPRRDWLRSRLRWNPIGPGLKTRAFGDAHNPLNTEQLDTVSMWWTVIALSTTQDPKGVRAHRFNSISLT